MNYKKALLIVMDGVGEAPEGPGNAVKLAHTPYMDSLYSTYPWTLVSASGNAVGVTEGYAGSSEAGHLTMGAGRIVWQPLEEISQVIHHGKLGENPEIRKMMDDVKFKACPMRPDGIKNVSLDEVPPTLHLIGMISDAGIHSHIDHLFGLLDEAKKSGIHNVLIHAIADGRDVGERTVKTYVSRIEQKLQELNGEAENPKIPKSQNPKEQLPTSNFQLSTLIGRYYAMDRALNWDRTQKAYDLLAYGHGETVENIDEALEAFYTSAPESENTDYYLPPLKFDSAFVGIQPGDSVIFWNFRSDRARQLTSAFAPEDFPHFPRKNTLVVPHISYLCIGPFSETLPVAFPANAVKNNLTNWLAQKNIPQLKIAEGEKVAHVTFFFNSQTHDVAPLEDHIAVESKKVASFAAAPEMSAAEITDAAIDNMHNREYGFILVNYANGDLVGHSGDLPATVQAMETIDSCLSRLIPCALQQGYSVVLTADHGNAEQMLMADGKQNPSHTTNPVRCLVIDLRDDEAKGENRDQKLRSSEGLSSITPTILDLMEIEKPAEMTALSLLEK